MTCRTCRHFSPQTTATGRIKRAAGRCAFPVEVPLLPITVDRKLIERALDCRRAAWPDDGADCPCWELRP